jgi:hypothetical protein
MADLEDALARTAITGTREWTAYARHYAGVTRGDRRIIEGVFVAFDKDSERPGKYVESEAELPKIFDRGCSVVRVMYDPSAKAITAQCNGR